MWALGVGEADGDVRGARGLSWGDEFGRRRVGTFRRGKRVAAGASGLAVGAPVVVSSSDKLVRKSLGR
jgi:hypothetical protein